MTVAWCDPLPPPAESMRRAIYHNFIVAAELTRLWLGRVDPLGDGGKDHARPNFLIARRGHRFVGFAHGVEHRQRLVDMLRPNLVDGFAGRRVAALGIAAVRYAGE